MKKLIKQGLRRAGYRLERIRPRAGANARKPGRLPALTEVDVRFHTGDWRYRVPATLRVGRPCFGYGPNSWHPFVATVAQLLENPDLDYEDSTLHSLYSMWQPLTTAEAQFPRGDSPHPVLARIPAHALFEPWQLRPPPCDNPLNPQCRPSGAPLHGPVDPQEGLKEFGRLQTMIGSIERYGYNPDEFPRGLIAGVLLEHEGRQRFLVTHGQHRTAVLTAMGCDEIEVGIRGDGASVVDSSEAQKWPHVVSGVIPAGAAVAQLARYFPSESHDGQAFKVHDVVRERS